MASTTIEGRWSASHERRTASSVTTAAASHGTRAPSGNGIVVRSQNGVGVVVERWERAGAGTVRAGFSATLGSPVASTRWLTAAGGTPSDGSQAEFILIVNPSLESIARVTVTVPTPTQALVPNGLEDLEVPPGGRVAYELGALINRDDLPLVVTSSEPVVVERGLYPTGGGFAQSMAIAEEGSASIPSVDTSAGAPVVVTEPPIATETTLTPPPPSSDGSDSSASA